jgi:hypothetical protein
VYSMFLKMTEIRALHQNFRNASLLQRSLKASGILMCLQTYCLYCTLTGVIHCSGCFAVEVMQVKEINSSTSRYKNGHKKSILRPYGVKDIGTLYSDVGGEGVACLPTSCRSC